MLELKHIESFYPPSLRVFKRHMLREYLQYKILEIIYASPWAGCLNFMGGTAIRIIHGNSRFSEDLDFDNVGMDREAFDALAAAIEKELKRQGLGASCETTFRQALRCTVRVSDLLFQYGVSAHREERILIHVDTQAQHFFYTPQKVVVNQLDVFVRVNVVPVDILLAQKFYAIFNRKRTMGRDFYDAVFLLARTRPDFAYLKEKTGIADMKGLKKKLSAFCKRLDFDRLAKDVEPFLFNPADVKKVIHFPEYVRSLPDDSGKPVSGKP